LELNPSVLKKIVDIFIFCIWTNYRATKATIFSQCWHTTKWHTICLVSTNQW